MNWTRQLVYGPPNAGKSYYGVSSMWDKHTHTKLREGKWLIVGQESNNDSFGVPESMIERFTSPTLDKDTFVKELTSFTNQAILAAKRGKPLYEVVFFDGLSEFDRLYEAVYSTTHEDDIKKNEYSRWDALMRQVYNLLTRLDPSVIGAHVITSAKVMERRKSKRTRSGTEIPGDPGYVSADYYPSIRGGMRLDLAALFNLVIYVEDEGAVQNKDGKWEAQHMYHLFRTEKTDFLIVNRYEEEWLLKGLPHEVRNLTFDKLMALVEKAKER